MNFIKQSFGFSFALFLQSTVLWAQSNQVVKVVEYQGDGDKTPLPGVVLSVHNAPIVTSDAMGETQLSFRTLHPGDKVNFRRAEKDGYEVFNQDALDQWVVSNNEPFRIVMCRSDRFRQLREQYMQKASANYMLQYQRDQDQLLAQRRDSKIMEEEYQKQLAELHTQYNKQLDNLENYVDRFARIDLESLSAEQRNIVQLVQEGRFDEAIAAYEAGNFLARYQQESQDIARVDAAQAQLQNILDEKLAARQKVLAAIDRQVTVYALAGGQENHQKIHALLKGTVDADTTNIRMLREYLLYAYRQLHHKEANDYAQIMLRQTKDHPDLQIWCYSVMGVAYQMIGDIEQASDNFAKGNDMVQFYLNNPDTPAEVKAACATFLTNYSSYQMMFGNYPSALESAKAAEPLLSQLYEECLSLERLVPLEAVRVTMAYSMYKNGGKMKKSFELLEKVKAELQPHLFKSDAVDNAFFVSMNRYAALSAQKRKFFKLSIQIDEELFDFTSKAYARNPRMFIIPHISVMQNVTKSCLMTRDWDRMENLTSQIEALIDELEALTKVPQKDHRFKCKFYRSLVAYNRDQTEESIQYANEALDIYNTLESSVFEQGQVQWSIYKDFLEQVVLPKVKLK